MNNFFVAFLAILTASSFIHLRASASVTGDDAAVAACRAEAWFLIDGVGKASSDDIDVNKARRLCNAARQTAPDNPKILAYLARVNFAAKDYKRAFELASLSARRGSGEGMVFLGVMHWIGKGARRDDGKTFALISKAASRDLPEGWRYLGALYENGVGVTKNLRKANQYYRQAANAGSAMAQYYLAGNYKLGRGAAKDLSEAFRWYLKAAKQGHASAQLEVGRAYETGMGVKKDFDAAIEWYEKSYRGGSKTGAFYYGLALQKIQTKESLRKALTAYEKALSEYHSKFGGDNIDVAYIRINYGNVLKGLERCKEAIVQYNMTEKILDKTDGNGARLAALYNSMGECYKLEENYMMAKKSFLLSLKYYEKFDKNNEEDISSVLSNIGVIFLEEEEFKLAANYFVRALELAEYMKRGAAPQIAAMYTNLGSAYSGMGDFEASILAHRRALSILMKKYGNKDFRLAGPANNLATAYAKIKRYKESSELLKFCISLYINKGMEDTINFANFLLNYGNISYLLGNDTVSVSSYIGAIKISGKILGDRNMLSQKAHYGLGSIYEYRSEYALAYEYYLKSARSTSFLERKTGLGSLSRTDRYSFVSVVRAASMLAREKVNRKKELRNSSFKMAQAALRTAASAALAQMAARQAAGDTKLARLVREQQDLAAEWRSLDKALTAQFVKLPRQRNAEKEKHLRARLKEIDARLKTIAVRLKKEFPEYAELASPQPLSIAQTQKLLRKREALLLLLTSDKGNFAWLVTRKGARWGKLDISLEELTSLVRKLRSGLDRSGAGARGALPLDDGAAQPQWQGLKFDLFAAHRLYRKLIAPFEEQLRDIEHLIVVPDGPLQSLPPSVLVTKKPARQFENFAGLAGTPWLIKRFAISVLPSVSSLRALRVFAKKSGAERLPFIGFGNPLLGGGGNGDRRGAGRPALASLFRGNLANVEAVRNLAPLPETAAELQRIAASLKASNDNIYLGQRASEKVLKSIRLDNRRVIAFATHGLVAGELKGLAEPALVLTPPATATEEDDGLLTASEVTGLKLDADWVILSACNTAASDGTPGAQGLSGLARAFFYAGSRALLVSHWPVQSDAAVRLTTGAFAAMDKTPAIGRAEAMRRSILAFMNDATRPSNAHPERWAPFVVVGEGN